MGQIKTDFIKEVTNTSFPKVFVETGTFLGGVPLMMLADSSFNDWKNIYTIELSDDACKIASTRYELFEKYGVGFNFNDNWSSDKDESFEGRKSYFNNKLHLLQGDSGKRLKDVLDEVDEPCAFWLDAHAGSKEMFARGEIDCPLLQELEIIKNHHIKEHFIAIDDAHLFGQVQTKDGEVVCDYSKITKEAVTDLILSINPEYTVELKQPYGQLMLVAYVKGVDPNTIVQGSNWMNF